jgi:hypothetical protein
MLAMVFDIGETLMTSVSSLMFRAAAALVSAGLVYLASAPFFDMAVKIIG